MMADSRLGEGNQGIISTGSESVTVTGSAMGIGTRVTTGSSPKADNRPPGSQWDLGVITILSEETRAVTDMLRRRARRFERKDRGALRFEEAVIDVTGGTLQVVSAQCL